MPGLSVQRRHKSIIPTTDRLVTRAQDQQNRLKTAVQVDQLRPQAYANYNDGAGANQESGLYPKENTKRPYTQDDLRYDTKKEKKYSGNTTNNNNSNDAAATGSNMQASSSGITEKMKMKRKHKKHKDKHTKHMHKHKRKQGAQHTAPEIITGKHLALEGRTRVEELVTSPRIKSDGLESTPTSTEHYSSLQSDNSFLPIPASHRTAMLSSDLSHSAAARAWNASPDSLGAAAAHTQQVHHYNYFLPKKTPYSKVGIDGSTTSMHHLPAVIPTPTTPSSNDTDPANNDDREAFIVEHGGGQSQAGVDGIRLTTIDQREIENTERAWVETKSQLPMYQPKQDILKLSSKLQRIREQATDNTVHPVRLSNQEEDKQSTLEPSDEQFAAVSSASVHETSSERAARRGRRRARRKVRQLRRFARDEADHTNRASMKLSHKHHKNKKKSSRKRRRNSLCGLYGSVLVWCEPKELMDGMGPNEGHIGNDSTAGGPNIQQGNTAARMSVSVRAAVHKASVNDTVMDTIREFDDALMQRKRDAKSRLYFGRVRTGTASDGDSDSGDDDNSGDGNNGGGAQGNGRSGNNGVVIGNGHSRRKRKVQQSNPVLKSSDRPPSDVLRQGGGKVAVCLHLRVSGIRARDLRKPEEARAFQQTVLGPLPWVRYTEEIIQDGIKVRSLRALDETDVMIYGAQRQRNQSRVRIGLLLWVNSDDARKVANCLARAAKNGILAADLARRSPAIRSALASHAAGNAHQGADGDDVFESATFVTEGGMSSNAQHAVRKKSLTTTTIVSQPAKRQPSVLSIEGSEALWVLRCRIEAGLEITEEHLRLAREEVRHRSDNADLALDCFNEDLNHVYKLHGRAKTIISDWKELLYEALIRAKHGPQPLRRDSSSNVPSPKSSWDSIVRNKRATNMHPKTGRKMSVHLHVDGGDGGGHDERVHASGPGKSGLVTLVR